LVGRIARDTVRNARKDDVTFLAGGVAFNLLLAGVPFLLLLAAGVGFLLGESPDRAAALLNDVLAEVLPRIGTVESTILDPVIGDVIRTRVAFGIGGAIFFLLFSARLFGSLRSVMALVFAHGRDRTWIGGVLWDVQLTAVSAVLLTAWVGLTTWLAVSSGRVGAALAEAGALPEAISRVEYWLGRLLSLVVLAAVYGSLYRWLPKKPTPWIPAIAGGVTASLLFELARWIFAAFVTAFPPSSLYSGSLGALVVVVFWTYYAALIFVLGAETAVTTRQQLEAEPAP
jgi:membrane protein